MILFAIFEFIFLIYLVVINLNIPQNLKILENPTRLLCFGENKIYYWGHTVFLFPSAVWNFRHNRLSYNDRYTDKEN